MTTACLYFQIMVAIEIVPLTNKERKRWINPRIMDLGSPSLKTQKAQDATLCDIGHVYQNILNEKHSTHPVLLYINIFGIMCPRALIIIGQLILESKEINIMFSI